MQRDQIIVLIKGDLIEVWGSLTEICRVHEDFSYNYLKKKKYPFEYKDWVFKKVSFRTLAKDQD